MIHRHENTYTQPAYIQQPMQKTDSVLLQNQMQHKEDVYTNETPLKENASAQNSMQQSVHLQSPVHLIRQCLWTRDAVSARPEISHMRHDILQGSGAQCHLRGGTSVARKRDPVSARPKT